MSTPFDVYNMRSFQECLDTILKNEASLLRMQESTQNELRELIRGVKEISVAVKSHDTLIETNSNLVKELGNTVKWMMHEQSRYRQIQSGLLWKVILAVVGTLNALILVVLALEGVF